MTTAAPETMAWISVFAVRAAGTSSTASLPDAEVPRAVPPKRSHAPCFGFSSREPPESITANTTMANHVFFIISNPGQRRGVRKIAYDEKNVVSHRDQKSTRLN